MDATSVARRRRAGIAAAAAVLGAVVVTTWFARPPSPASASTTAADGVPTFLPAAPDEVLERLPVGAARVAATARALRARQAAGTADERLALALASMHLRQARADGDAREAGRAQAALAPWWSRADASADVILLRASIRQHLHAFDAALADLDALIARDPGERRAWWQRAALLQTVGRLDEALADCRRTAALGDADDPAPRVCVAEIESLQGDREATPRLASTLSGRQVPSGTIAWIRLVLAESAEREDRVDEADRLYRLAHQGADGPYSRVAHADLLLARGRDDEAEALLADAPQTDAVLVRRAIATQRLGSPLADGIAATLRARLDAERGRDDASLHLREAARFALDVEHDAAGALELAQRNWAAQKEPADALLLARAARAAGREDAVAPLRAFVSRNRWHDLRLAREGVAP